MKDFLDYDIDVRGVVSGEVDTTCPQCSASRRKKNARCLSVSIDQGLWCCHHCGWTGTLKRGAEGPSNPNWWRKIEHRRPSPLRTQEISSHAQAWFEKRLITLEVLRRNRISTGDVYMPQTEQKESCIRFPYYRGEELVNVKYRDKHKNFRMESGAERVLFGLNDIAETTIVVEGEVDKLSLEIAGFQNCVSVPDGAPPPIAKDYASKFSFLEADSDRLSSVAKWILAVDSDEPGQKLEEELARRFGPEKCSRVRWPVGCKDANEVLCTLGVTDLRTAIESAQPYPVDGLFNLRDFLDRMDYLREHGFDRGVETGWRSIDPYYTVRPGEVTVITGIPNHGKSNWLDALLVNLAKGQGWVFGIFSPENQPLERHGARLMEKWLQRPYERGPNERISDEAYEIGKQKIAAHFDWILPKEDKPWTVDFLLSLARVLVFRKGIKGLVIDPWNEIDHTRPQNLTETEYISESLTKVRRFARSHGVHVWLVAHPAKLRREAGGYPVPSPYDISGSAHWRNKADNCLTVYRDLEDPDSQAVQIHVQKVRFREIGKVGLAELAYNHLVGTYHELDRARDEIPPKYGSFG